MARKKSKGITPIESTRHTNETRLNNPTEELRGFELEEEGEETMLYPRDPSLDPQLVWKGKDEQDQAENLSVPILPIYKQEGITPEDIIKQLRHESQQEHASEVALFSDFNGLSFQEMIEFYRHEQNWTNRMILGDSLQVMTSLAEKEGVKGKVQTIYIDPPYGINFGSNWQVSTRKRGVEDTAQDATRQPEQVRAFRDTWEQGIHSYLTYLRDRLTIARDLLTESGSVFVQIGDANVHLVRSLLDEIFGVANFAGQIAFQKTTGSTTATIPQVFDYLLWYTKDLSSVKFHKLYVPQVPGAPGALEYKRVELPDGTLAPISQFTVEGRVNLPQGARVFTTDSIVSKGGDSPDIELEWAGKTYTLSCKPNRHWKPGVEGIERLWQFGRLLRQEGLRIYKRYLNDFPYRELANAWTDTRGEDDAVYVVQTDTRVVDRCILMTTDPGDLVLDPTCGSGTTAYVAEQRGRRWITIDTSRVALALARTRLMSAKYPYYLLADSPEGIKREAEITGQASPSPIPKTEGDIRKGFVYKRVPHITLGSIANNPYIQQGMSREEVDAAIARYADSETLFDQPYEDKKRLRVAGPFTVESLSPHRAISEVGDSTRAETSAQGSANGQFETIILENLKKAGVQNTVKGERLIFDRLEPYAGTWIHAEGDYTENGSVKSVGVCIGPQYGTVDSRLIQDAAKEAIRVFDLLVVCGMAFDPHVYEETKRYPNLTVILPRVNADLSMGDELLKKTGAGNLFTVFGEPDIEVRTPNGNGKLEVEIKGLDIYDPTTGQIRSNSTDDIACWFIDTNYSGNSFIVRHAYFTGADKPYEKLKKTLKAEIDEAAWSSLYSTVSRTFDAPEGGKIAVKVINHYGDEVLKVCDTGSGSNG
jgi:adenine-specific DNA-methyltransferase